MKDFIVQNLLLLSSAILVTSSAVNFNPTTGETEYPTVVIETTIFGISERSQIEVPLNTVKQLRLPLKDADDPISGELFDGLDLPPSLTILSGRVTVPDQFHRPDVSIHHTAIIGAPDLATSTVCRFSPLEHQPDRELKFGTDNWAEFRGSITGVHCTSYFKGEKADTDIDERIKSFGGH